MPRLTRGEALRALRHGEVVAVPTESSFGLAVRADRAEAVRRLFAIKPGRNTPIPLVVSSAAAARSVAAEFPIWAQELARNFWPGALTVVLRAQPDLAPEISAGTNTVGVRVPGFAPLRELLADLALPLTATSANRPGDPPQCVAAEIEKQFPDLAIWAPVESTAGGPPSTVVAFSDGEVRVLRPGRVMLSEYLAIGMSRIPVRPE